MKSAASSPESLNITPSDNIDADGFSEAELLEAEQLMDRGRGISFDEAKAIVRGSRTGVTPHSAPVTFKHEVAVEENEPLPSVPADALFDFDQNGTPIGQLSDSSEIIAEIRAESLMDKAERLIKAGYSQVAAQALLRAQEERRHRIA